MKNVDRFKLYLAAYMAEIDSINFPDQTFEEHLEKNMDLRDFELLQVWLGYNGVFDGGEDMLVKLKILV